VTLPVDVVSERSKERARARARARARVYTVFGSWVASLERRANPRDAGH
jgi:hypothetical protein